MARHLITSALPYINGVKHLGNLIGSMLPADVYARYLRQRNHEVLYICATDEHGTPAELAANATGESVADYCERLHKVQSELAKQWGLSMDYFGRSSSPQNKELTQQFARSLNKQGLIEQRVTTQAFSVADNRFLPDRYVQGTCPHCGYTSARGDQCENCTRTLEPSDLVEPRSAISGSTDIEFRDSAHLFLLQSKMVGQLRTWLDTKQDWPILARSIASKWLDEGLDDRGITRDLKWGVPVPNDWPELAKANKVFYVWFDAPIEYISATWEWADQDPSNRDYKSWWYDTNDVKYTQFMAKDNVPFHTVSFPATILGTGEPWKLVDYLKSFNWLTYYGGKFSTSQGRGVFMDDALELLPADIWRYTLLANAPEGSDADFTWDMLGTAVNKDLGGTLGNFVNRVLTFSTKNFGDAIPDQGEPGDIENEFARLFDKQVNNLAGFFEQLEYRKAMGELRSLWSLGNAYLDKVAPWKTIKEDKESAAMQLRTAIAMANIFARCSMPVMPQVSLAISGACGSSRQDWPEAPGEEITTGSPGDPIVVPEILFPRIEDEQLHQWEERFGGS